MHQSNTHEAKHTFQAGSPFFIFCFFFYLHSQSDPLTQRKETSVKEFSKHSLELQKELDASRLDYLRLKSPAALATFRKNKARAEVLWGSARALATIDKAFSANYLSKAHDIGFKGLDKQQVESLLMRYNKLKSQLTTHITNVELRNEVDKVMEYLRKMVRGGDVGGVASVGSLFELSVFKNLTARIPTGSKLTNLRKAEFLEYGYKVKPTSGRVVFTLSPGSKPKT